ncbi:MAG: hypothetical protein ACJAZO_003077 [Myxococcota bacterium]|jgi:hypothetical protein
MRLVSTLLAVSLALPAFAQEEPADGTMTRSDAEESEIMDTNDMVPTAETMEGSEAEPAPLMERPAPVVLETIELEADPMNERVGSIEDTLLKQRADLTRIRLQMLDVPDLTFDLEGEYRSRGYLYPNLFDGQERDARYMDHWLRLRPIFRYKELASLHIEFRGLQNVIWGDNASVADTPLFAEEPSFTTLDGQENPSFVLKRAWVEFNIPVGIVRVGRQPSAWGLGILVNGGDGFDDIWGENRGATTFDRALFATKPISIAQTIMGKDNTDIPFYFAVSVDRLVESPVTEYFGYECQPNIPDTDDRFDSRCDTNGDGITDQDNSFTNPDFPQADREQDWWADQDDDVWELVLALIYRGEDVRYLGGRGDLSVGGYAIHRLQRETTSDVWIVDGYLEADVHNVSVAFEGIGIVGNSSALTLPDRSLEGDVLAKKVNIGSYVARLGYKIGEGDIRIETGFASGDNDPADSTFTGRPGNSDYNVGLIIYEEVLSRTTAQRWSQAARGLWSGGGVYNSRYLHPVVHYSPLNNWDLYGGAVLVWPHKPDGSIIQCKEGDNVECAQNNATQGMIGWELDGALKHRFHEHILLSVEAGYAHVTDRIPLQAVGLNPNGNFFTAQARVAWEF